MRTRRLTPPSNLVHDLVAANYPPMAARLAERQVKNLAHQIVTGRISLADARAKLRGAV